MKGLIIKDLYTLINNRRQYAIVLIMGAIFTFIFKDNGQYMSVMFTLILLMSVYTSFTYDVTAKWDQYAVCLPLSRKQIVLSKYLIMLIGLAASMLLVGAIILVNVLLDTDMVLSEFLLIGTMQTGLVFVSVCIGFPFIYKWGPEKARIAMMGGILVPILLIIGLEKLFPGWLDALIATGAWFYVILLGVAAILFVVSFWLSTKIYSEKEF